MIGRPDEVIPGQLAPEVGLKGRFQWDNGARALGEDRSYLSAGGSAWWKPIAWMLIDAGVTFRTGEAEDEDTGLDTEYDNVIFHVGVAASY